MSFLLTTVFLSIIITFMKIIKAHKTYKTKVHKPRTQQGNSLRISVRISSAVTSLSIKKNLIALWILLHDSDTSGVKDSAKLLLTDFVYECLNQWNKDTAKGFSDFVSDKLIESFLEKEDYIEYKLVLDTLQE